MARLIVTVIGTELTRGEGSEGVAFLHVTISLGNCHECHDGTSEWPKA